MADEEVIVALLPLVQALDRLGVAYQVGGSLASSFHGIPRSTIDADVVADLARPQVAALVASLEAEYYIDAEMIYGAIGRRASFTIIHYQTAMKIDVYLLRTRPFDLESFARRVSGALDGREGGHLFQVESAEDVVLHKLEWFRLGGGVADRQWTDVLGVLKLKADGLDLRYLWRWARELDLEDSLRRALVDAGLPSNP